MSRIMAKARLTRLLRTALFVGLAAWGVGCTAYPSDPSEPAFDTDVLPIFQAHCTRCHGAGPPDGGLNSKNLNPGSAVNYDGGRNCALLTSSIAAPDLTRYGPCVAVDGGAEACPPALGGAASYRTLIQQDVHLKSSCSQMPPPPAPALDDYELKVIDAWTTQMPLPICSHSSSPDPALLCP